MMHLSKRLSLYITSISMTLVVSFGLPSLVYAEDTAKYVPVPTDVCQGEVASNPACTASNEDPVTGSNGVIMRIANVTAFAAGALAIIMIIFAGFRLVKSGGDSSKVTVARETIIYSLIGIVVIVSARLIIGFVISKL